MAVRLTLTILGMFLGAGMIGIALHDKVIPAWQVLTGQPVRQESKTYGYYR